MFIILQEYRKLVVMLMFDLCLHRKLEKSSRMLDSSFAAVFVALFVACRADKLCDIIQTKLPHMEEKSETMQFQLPI